MNAGGVSSLGSALWAMEDGEFVPSHHCEGTVVSYICMYTLSGT